MYEEIKAEIERQMAEIRNDFSIGFEVQNIGKIAALSGLLDFIESLPKPSEDLEKVAEEYGRDLIPLDQCDTRDIVNAFIAGAQWQKEKEREYSPWLSIPGLKDASLEFAQQAKDYEIGGQTWTEDMAVAFTRGAEWQKEQMIPVTALVNESKDFLSLSLSSGEYAKIGRRFKGGDDIEIYIKRDKK